MTQVGEKGDNFCLLFLIKLKILIKKTRFNLKHKF
jgi:hypothetical protein